MQIIVFGMHRSGTSPLARLINMMGAYAGQEDSLIEPRIPNPKGYWERKDVQLLNDEIFQSVDATWSQVTHFEAENISDHSRATFEEKAAQIVYNLDAHRPWVLKDPRLCLTFPVWRNLLEVPVCVYIYRHPLEVAQSLKTRGDLSVSTGIALWEKYNLGVLRYTQGLPRLLVSHGKLMEQPVETVTTLHTGLTALGVQGLRCPSEREVRAFVDSSLYHERIGPQREQEFVNAVQLKLFEALEDGSVQDWETVPALSGGALEILALSEEQAKNTHARQEVVAWQQKLAEAEAAQQTEVVAWQQKLAEAAQRAVGKEAELEVMQTARQEERQRLEAQLTQLQDQLRQAGKRVAEREAQLTVTQTARQEERQRFEAMLTQLQDQLKNALPTTTQKDTQLSALTQQLTQRSEDVNRLVAWIEKLDMSISALLHSKRWKIGNAIGEVLRSVQLKPRVPTAQDALRTILTQFQTWKRNANQQR